MQKTNEDEKKVNLIKCPLPKIIYMTMKGLSTFPKKPEKSTNSTTYYTKKLNPYQPGLPSLKMNSKLSFSPNKTNYVKGKPVNNLNNINSKKVSNFHTTKNNNNDNSKDINHNKENQKQSMKEILNSYGLNRYYEKFIQNGINDQNFNQIGCMSKKKLNDFINILNIFPSHTIKIEQLYLHLKKLNNDNLKTQSNINIHLNSSTKEINNSNLNNSQININNSSANNNNNNVNYVTLTFNRANLKNIKTRISNSQNKYRYMNPKINIKRANSNRASSEKNQSKKINRINYHSQRPNLGSKNKSRKKLLNDNIISKYNFAPPKPVNPGRNDLIKYFFKDLDNVGPNMSSISNLTNLNLFKHHNKKNRNFNKTNNNSLTGSLKELNHSKNKNNNNNNIYYTKYVEKHSAPENNNLQVLNHGDLPSIKNLNARHIKISTHYSKSLLSSINENNNGKINIETKTGYNKLTKQFKKNNENIIDNSKVISGYQVPYSMKTFFNDNYIKNINKRNSNKNNSIKIQIKKKDILKNSYNGNNNIKNIHSSQRSQIDIAKKNKLNNEIKIKLPNVIKKLDVQQSVLSKEKTKTRTIKNMNRHLEGNEHLYSSTHIIYNNRNEINKKEDKIFSSSSKVKTENETNPLNSIKENENNNNIRSINTYDKINDEKEFKILEKVDEGENKKENIININIEEKNDIPLIPKENISNIQEIIIKHNDNNNTSEPGFNSTQNSNNNTNIIINQTDKNLNSQNNAFKENLNLISKPSTDANMVNIKPEKIETNVKDPLTLKEEKLEDMIYESLRLNRSFSENKTDNVYLFDLEFLCRCLGLCLSILIETSKESPHITEINLEALSASEIKYFFFNDVFNENINFLFDVFDKEVNTDINLEQISPLDKLESYLSLNDTEHINFDINYLKHIRKEKDDALIKIEEAKENQKPKETKEEQKPNNQGIGGKEGFKIRTGFGEIEKDIRFIDEFFSINNRKKKKAKNYNFISDMSKNILCKELSYINEIDSELNGTNSNINNTNLCNNSNSNNNINEKNMKEENSSNLMDNEEIKEIKEIQDNNAEEDNNKSFHNEMNELGIITESNDDTVNKNNIEIKNNSNNSINIKAEEGNNFSNKKDLEMINFNEDNKIISSNINNEENNINEKDNSNLKNTPVEININNNEQKIKVKSKINNLKTNINNFNEVNIIQEQVNDTNEVKEPNKVSVITQNYDKDSKELNKNEVKNEKEEDDIYESDYILDIASIDELTYYLIKRAEIFDEDFNYIFMKITERRYIPTPEPQTIFDFMADIIILTKMEKEVVVLSLIYIERLIYNTGLLLTSRNWRRILLTSMIIASKIWDDNSFENGHFSQVFANLGINEINTLERIFLELINYKVYVKQSEYFKYLMMIKVIALKYTYNGREIVRASVIKNLKYQEFNETMQNRMRKKITLNNSAQF